MNTNFFHNILNVVGLLIGALITVDWTVFGYSPETAASIAGIVLVSSNMIKLTMNVTRDGVSGLTKNQPPVK